MTLQDIRTAVINYVDTKVTCTVGAIIPEVPIVLSPKENFTFSVAATNATVALGGVRLKNIRYYVSTNGLATLKVPPSNLGKCFGSINPSGTPFTPDADVTGFYLNPPEGDFKYLDPGETDTIVNLKGTTKSLGSLMIEVKVFADIDLDYLFPPNQDSAWGTKTIQVQ